MTVEYTYEPTENGWVIYGYKQGVSRWTWSSYGITKAEAMSRLKSNFDEPVKLRRREPLTTASGGGR